MIYARYVHIYILYDISEKEQQEHKYFLFFLQYCGSFELVYISGARIMHYDILWRILGCS